MKRAIAFAGACLLALAPLAVQAQSAPGITTPFQFAGINQQATIPLNGQTTCSVAVASITSATLTPLASTDNSTYYTVTSIGSGAITAAGTYTGNVATFALNFFRLQQTTTGSASGTITCSTFGGNSSAQGSATGTPTVVLGLPNTVGQPCIGVSTLSGKAVPSANQTTTLVASTTQQVIGITAGAVTHVCSFDLSATLTVGGTFSLEYGTGTNCGTGTVVFDNINLGAGTFDPGRGTGSQDLFSIPTGQAFCVVSPAFTGTAFLNTGTSTY